MTSDAVVMQARVSSPETRHYHPMMPEMPHIESAKENASIQ